MILQFLLYFIGFIFIFFLYKFKKNHIHFNRNGIKYSPGVPIFGNIFGSTFALQHLVHDLDDVYKKFPDEKYVGFVEGTRRFIMIRDLDMAKLVLVKDFNHFVDRKEIFPHELDPLLGNSVINLKGDSWREMRARLTSSFTSSKIKIMMPLMVEVADNIINYIKDNQSESVNVTELMRQYSNDVMASTAFGLRLDSIKNKNNDFYEIGKDTVHFNIWKMLSLFFTAEWPKSINLMKMLGLYITTPKNTKFFRDIVINTINYRKKNNVTRPDLIHLLLEASKEIENLEESDKSTEPTKSRRTTIKEWTNDEIAGQAYIAFLAGFESTASTITICVHLLVLHPHVQEKLYQEIKENEDVNGLTYESLHQLKYMDWVFSEAERLWSAGVVLDRTCTKPYDLPPPRAGRKPYRLNTGDVVYIPLNSIHMDERYFPEPKIFDPERFSDENKHTIKPFSFMPFGMGPRSCLGIRFAIPELKVILYQIVLNFRIEKCEKTVENIHLEPGLFNIKAKGGSWVRFESRN